MAECIECKKETLDSNVSKESLLFEKLSPFIKKNNEFNILSNNITILLRDDIYEGKIDFMNSIKSANEIKILIEILLNEEFRNIFKSLYSFKGLDEILDKSFIDIYEYALIFQKNDYTLPYGTGNSIGILSMPISIIESVLKEASENQVLQENLFVLFDIFSVKKVIQKDIIRICKVPQDIKKIIDYFLGQGYLYQPFEENINQRLIKVSSVNFNDSEMISKLEELFGEEFQHSYFYTDKEMEGTIAYTIFGNSFISGDNIKRSHEKKSQNLLSFEEYRDSIIINELVHKTLDKIYGFDVLNDLSIYGLDDIDTGINSYRETNTKNISEFLSDVGSFIVTNKMANHLINNLFIGNEISFGNNEIDIYVVGMPAYEYSNRFMVKCLNNLIKEGKIDYEGLKGIKNKVQYLEDNLEEQDYFYIKTEYINQGKRLMSRIKRISRNINLQKNKKYLK